MTYCVCFILYTKFYLLFYTIQKSEDILFCWKRVGAVPCSPSTTGDNEEEEEEEEEEEYQDRVEEEEEEEERGEEEEDVQDDNVLIGKFKNEMKKIWLGCINQSHLGPLI